MGLQCNDLPSEGGLSDPKRADWPSKKCTLEATGIYGPSMTTVPRATPPRVSSSDQLGWDLLLVAGTHFFQDATFNRGHAHPEGSRLVDPDEEFFPPSLVSQSMYQLRRRSVVAHIGGLFTVPTIFFCAHAVRAQSSDGHKNVLSLIGYSHLLENR